MAFFVVPSAVAFAALGDVIAGVLLQTGRFTAADSRYVWAILAGSSIGLLATTMARLYSVAHYAVGDTKSPLRFALVRLVVVDDARLPVRDRAAAAARHRAAVGRRGADGVGGRGRLDGVRAAAASLNRAHRRDRARRSLPGAAVARGTRRRRARGASAALPPLDPLVRGAVVLPIFGADVHRRRCHARASRAGPAPASGLIGFSGWSGARAAAWRGAGDGARADRPRRRIVSGLERLEQDAKIPAHDSTRLQVRGIGQARHHDDLRRVRRRQELPHNAKPSGGGMMRSSRTTSGSLARDGLESLAARRRGRDGVAFVLEPRSRSARPADRSRRRRAHAPVCERSARGCREHHHPDAITLLALVERAGVFVTGEHRIGATAWTLVHI